MSMDGRVVVVTGASGNLGAAVVARLQRAGAVPIPLAHKDADLSDEAQVEAAYEKALQRSGALRGSGHCAGRWSGALWGSVHCAGGWTGAPFAQTTVEIFERMVAINLRSTFLCCRAALRRLRGDGRIVNVAALTAAALAGVGGSAAYAASKAG